MNYLNFVVITDTPGKLATWLTTRGVLKQEADGSYTGVKPGMEWAKVPNPIQTAPAVGNPGDVGYVPPVMDARSVFLVKLAHESADDNDDGTPQVDAEGKAVNQYDWSKFGKWVKANSTVASAPANYTINGQPAGNAYKVTGQNVWLVRDNPERFGVWQ